MTKKFLLSLILLISINSPNAFAGFCRNTHLVEKDSSKEFLAQINEQQKMYRKDLFGPDKMDPYFLKTFGDKIAYKFPSADVSQNYPFAQGKESVENVVSRLRYIKDNWSDYKISRSKAKLINIEFLNELIARGESLLERNEWNFSETMDFIDVGLIFGSSLRSKKESGKTVVDDSYLQSRNVLIEKHGKADPGRLYGFAMRESGVAYTHVPHPALIQPFLVQDRLFEMRESNWALTKGAVLITVSPHKDIEAHGVVNSYWSFAHDLGGHLEVIANNRAMRMLEKIYNQKGLKKLDDKNRNKNEAKKLIEAYVKLREGFLTDLLSKGEKKLSPEDQVVFHESLFNYLHELEGGYAEPVRMLETYANEREKTPVNLFIIKTLEKYIKTHDVSAFQL